MASIIDSLDYLNTRIGTLEEKQESKENKVLDNDGKHTKKGQTQFKKHNNSKDSDETSDEDDNSNDAATKALRRLAQLGLTSTLRDSASESGEEDAHSNK